MTTIMFLGEQQEITDAERRWLFARQGTETVNRNRHTLERPLALGRPVIVTHFGLPGTHTVRNTWWAKGAARIKGCKPAMVPMTGRRPRRHRGPPAESAATNPGSADRSRSPPTR